jgi:hypothetical protein
LRNLSARQLDRLFELIVRLLRDSPLDAPLFSEREPSYAARVLEPTVNAYVRSLDIAGLVVAGEGSGPPRPVYHLGLEFFPDITLHRYGQPLIAFEVKYCKGFQRQDQIAKAMGQALIYRLCGYGKSGIFVIDFENKMNHLDISQADERQLTFPDMVIVVRRKLGRALLQH